MGVHQPGCPCWWASPKGFTVSEKKLMQRRDCALSRISPALLSTAPYTVFPLHRRRTITAAACSPATTQSLSPRRARPHPPDYCCCLHRVQDTAHR